MLRIIDLQSSRSIARCARQFSSLSLVALALLSMSSLALANPINYGNFSGTTVDYISVEENSGTDPLLFPPNLPGLGLFGAPTVAGDSLDFSPNNFFADSQFATPLFDQTDGHLTFGVNAKANHAITNINFQEGGGLSVVGFGVNDQTFVDVSAVGLINVLEIDGAAPIGLPVIPINLTFNFGTLGNGTWARNSNGFVNGFLWIGAQAIDIKGWLNANGFPTQHGATKLTVSLDNSLYAQSELTGGAFIDKKDFGGLSITVDAPVIPEPATWVLGMLGCLAVGARRRMQ
jgi:hypothetical protein